MQEKQQQVTEQRHQQQQQDERLRTQLEEKRLAWQAAKSDFHHYSEQLKAMDSDLITGLAIDLPAHQAKLEKAQQQSIQSQQELELLRRQSTQTQQQTALLEKDGSFLKAQNQQINQQIEQAKKFVDPVQLELPTL